MALQNEFRYWQSYRTARQAVSLGRILKVVAPMLFLLACMLALFSSGPGIGDLRVAAWRLCFLSAVGFVIGVIFEVIGRILVMATDTAVYGAPKLTDDEKATIIERNWKE
jgi:hypothetical protein